MDSSDFIAGWEPGVAVAPHPPARKRMRGTPQQEAFFGRLVEHDDNIVLEARAGTGKSSSCSEGMNRLVESGVNPAEIRYTAFNKSIADEFRRKAPAGASVGTFHSFCFAALRSAFGNPVVDGAKTYAILNEIGDATCKPYLRKSIAKLVSAAKNAAYNPEDTANSRYGLLETIVEAIDLETWNQTDTVVDWAAMALTRSLERTDVIDFDDQLWQAYLYDVPFPSCGVLFVDECQDLNGIQHALLPRLNPNGRTVAVGDRLQSIYGFRGADVNSIPNLIRRLGATVLPLTVTFRCPKSHVALARQWARDFEAHDDNTEGEIIHSADQEMILFAAPGDQVLCRRNAPLVTAALEAIAAGRPAYVRGRAFGEALRPIVNKCNAATMPTFLANVDRWLDRRLSDLSEKEGSEDAADRASDQARAIAAVASACQSPAEVPNAIAKLFDETSLNQRVTFSSVHRAKGTEARRIFLIEQGSVGRKRKRPPTADEIQQERNVSYVAYTRSLDSLCVITEGE